MKTERQQHEERDDETFHQRRKDADTAENHGFDGELSERDGDADDEMERGAAEPVFPLERKAVTEPEEGGRQQRPEITADEPRREIVRPWRRLAGKNFLRQRLAEEKESDERP